MAVGVQESVLSTTGVATVRGAGSRAFLLAEVVGSAVVVGLLLSLVLSSVHMLAEAEAQICRRSAAVLVLDNVVEVLCAGPPRSGKAAVAVLGEEFLASRGDWPAGTAPFSQVPAGGQLLGIRSGVGHVLASVVIPWQEDSP